jgi:peptidoglycan/xylan/chitin deacetylase (PgdA/CDA1 family)
MRTLLLLTALLSVTAGTGCTTDLEGRESAGAPDGTAGNQQQAPAGASGRTGASMPQRPRTVPDKLVVLTFDDSVKSHFTVARPLLLKYGFGATFFITEGFGFTTHKDRYMTWEEIARLDADGFEIGNHTRSHLVLNPNRPHSFVELKEEVQAINDRCREYGIPRPVSFAYPGNQIDPRALPILEESGIRFARRGSEPEYPYKEGGGCGYQPGLDHPLLIPTAGDARPDWTLDDFRRAVERASHGRIAVLQFHGVPDVSHPWVSTPAERFEEYMKFLADNGYTVIALRDVAKYIDTGIKPRDPFGVIRDRQQRIAAGQDLLEVRPPRDEDDLRRWLENMVWHHRFAPAEIRAATGLEPEPIAAALDRFGIRPETRPARPAGAPLLVLPYPGGRHPRTGFLDGAIRPQRETKVSVFLPWDPASYVVLDVPEAIRRHDEPQHGLLYLAHAHVDTMWTKQGLELEPLEWQRRDGSLIMERTLPNGVAFGTRVTPTRDAVRMEMWLTNGSDETLRELRVQNCVMLAGAPEFAAAGPEAKLIHEPYIACRSAAANRWVITAWTDCQRAWANPPCPCIHSDPAFPDTAPGETHRLRGWLSFYEGADIEAELRRIDATGWHTP